MKDPNQATWSMKLVQDFLCSVVVTQEEILHFANLSLKPKAKTDKPAVRIKSSSPAPTHQEEPNSSTGSFGTGATGGGSDRASKKR